ncbi:MAG: hypothetical protein IT454_14435 [Planctomycetes bacterium]|nr:hypothetical protein [Planctomycetota bacterium]
MACWFTTPLALLALDVALRPQTIDALFAARRYEQAWNSIEDLEDATLREEWRFQILYAAGDLEGALRAIRSGLALAPNSERLLRNGASCALALGLATEANELCARWRRVLEADDHGSPERDAALQALLRFETDAAKLTLKDQEANRARRRAITATVAFLALAATSVAWLSRAPRK